MNFGIIVFNVDFIVEFCIGLMMVLVRFNGNVYVYSGFSNGVLGVVWFYLVFFGMGEVWIGMIISIVIWCLGMMLVCFEGDSYIGGVGGVVMLMVYCSFFDWIVIVIGIGGFDMIGICSCIFDLNNCEFLFVIIVFWDGLLNGLVMVLGYCD